MPLVLNGTTGVQDNSGAFVSGTAVASTSGTSIDFTSIPSWVKRITVNFGRTSISGTSGGLVSLGTSGGVVSTGYIATAVDIAPSGIGALNSTAGFPIRYFNASFAISGSMIISLLSSNRWVCSSVLNSTTDQNQMIAGDVTLSGTLDRVRITTVNGTDTFDAGSINILYE